MKKNLHSAFTLVELLVVIGIIGLLIAILLPSLNKARESAKSIVCESNMRQIGQGFRMYAEANKGALPAAGEDGDPAGPLTLADNQGWASEALWMNAVSRAVMGKTYNQIQLDAAKGIGRIPINGDHHVLVCPSASASVGVNTGTDADEMSPDGYFLMHGIVNTNGVITREARKTFICYAMNYKLFNANVFTGKLTQLRPGSEVVLVYEKRTNAGEVTPADDDYYNAMAGGAGKIITAPLGRFKGDWKRLTTRHNKGGHLLFADGHVRLYTLKQLMTPPTIGINNWNHPGETIWDVVGPATK